MSTISGSVAISGGNGGLGLAIAEGILERGGRVVLLGRRPYDEVRADLETLGHPDRVEYRRHEALDAVSTGQAIADIDDLSGAVVNAAIFRGAPFLSMTESDFADTINVNVTGSFLFAQAAARKLVELGGGPIVMISSWTQDVPDYGSAAYCASKGALRMLSKVMALELAQHNVRVNSFCPGIVEVGMAGRQIKTDEEYRERAKLAVPLDRFQSGRDVADGVCYLLSSEAAYLTGSSVVADGGASLFRRDFLHAVN